MSEWQKWPEETTDFNKISESCEEKSAKGQNKEKNVGLVRSKRACWCQMSKQSRGKLEQCGVIQWPDWSLHCANIPVPVKPQLHLNEANNGACTWGQEDHVTQHSKHQVILHCMLDMYKKVGKLRWCYLSDCRYFFVFLAPGSASKNVMATVFSLGDWNLAWRSSVCACKGVIIHANWLKGVCQQEWPITTTCIDQHTSKWFHRLARDFVVRLFMS